MQIQRCENNCLLLPFSETMRTRLCTSYMYFISADIISQFLNTPHDSRKRTQSREYADIYCAWLQDNVGTCTYISNLRICQWLQFQSFGIHCYVLQYQPVLNLTLYLLQVAYSHWVNFWFP